MNKSQREIHRAEQLLCQMIRNKELDADSDYYEICSALQSFPIDVQDHLARDLGRKPEHSTK
jgi:hypothetical protein